MDVGDSVLITGGLEGITGSGGSKVEVEGRDVERR
jgi:hypothetical protein